jgi:hypothetical protein
MTTKTMVTVMMVVRSYVLPSSVQQKWDAFAAAYLAENPQKRLQYIPHMVRVSCRVVRVVR